MTTFNIENPKLTAKNPHFGNKYAPLDEVLRVVNKGLPEGNSILQYVNEAGLFVSEVYNKLGKVSRSVAFPFVYKDDPQGLGSALTYARRYGLCLLFNLVGEDDDDAEAAHGRGTKDTKQAPVRRRRAQPQRKA